MNHIYKLLFKEKHITKSQYTFFDSVQKEEVISLYYELRLALYIGIMLFTSGVGYLVYQNIGSIGHILIMTLLFCGIIAGFYFISKFAKPYANTLVSVKLVYFDYLLILVALLVIGLLTYIQVYFELTSFLVSWSSYISAAIFIFIAYRYDNRALLSMGITAITAALGFSISYIDWIKNEWNPTNYTYLTAIFLGVALYALGYFSKQKQIKAHFKFTYQNFGLILFYLSSMVGLFNTDYKITYAILIVITAIALSLYTWKEKEFLFFLYATISGYVAITYLFFRLIEVMNDAYILMIYYFPITCIGYISFLINKKSHFVHE